MSKDFLCLCLCCLLLPREALLQWQGLRFQHFTDANGLSSAEIRAIGQDSVGYMYFAGYQQLIRYDGNVFEDFTHDPGDSSTIGPGQINQITTGQDGRLWLTMRRDGINVYDPKTETFTRYKIPSKENQASHLVQDHHGALWIGTDASTLIQFDPATETFTSYTPPGILPEHLPFSTITKILQDQHHPERLWVSVYYYGGPDLGASSYKVFQFNIDTKVFEAAPCFGNVMHQDKKGRIWTGSWSSGLWRYDPVSGKCDHLLFHLELPSGANPGPGVFSMLPVGDQVWIGSRGALLAVNEDLSWSVLMHTVEDEFFEGLFRDMRGNIWASSNKGLRVLYPGYQHIGFYSLTAFGYTDRIYPGRLAFDPQRQIIYLANRNEPRIYSIPLDRKQHASFIPTPVVPEGLTIWNQSLIVSGHSQLYQLRQDHSLQPVFNTILEDVRIPWLWSMTTVNSSTIAGVGPNVFFALDTGKQRIRFYDHTPPQDEVFESHSRMYFPSPHEVILSGGGEVREINLENGDDRKLVAPQTEHVIRDRQGRYWVGTINHLGQYHKSGDSLILDRYYTANDGLRNFTANHLMEDHRGRIWIFSGNGISALDPQTHETRNIGVSEGLPSGSMDPVQVLLLPDGRLATVSGNGVIVFHPDSVWSATTSYRTPVVIKQIRVNGHIPKLTRHVHFMERIELGANENSIDISFQGLTYPMTDQVQYSYQITGLQPEWIGLDRTNSVTLAKLQPGRYHFRIKAAPPDIDAPVKELQIFIATPFYRQVWFLALCLMALLSGLFLFYKSRIIRIRKMEEEKTRIHKQIADLELTALRSQMNPHFMFNSLNSIKNYILKNDTQKAAEYLSNFAHLIRLILQNSREKTISLHDELETLLLYIDLEKLRFRNGFEFICQVDSRIDTIQVQIPPMILQPFVENAIWHGLLHKEDHRLLMLRVSAINHQVLCEIEDNGIGRKQAAAIKSKSATPYKSMGMGITHDRIALMNSMDALGIEVDLTDKVDNQGTAAGTLVKIKIPYANPHH